MNNKIKFTPIGGVGQIGSNMALIETSSSRFIIDVGILFPYEDFFDINYLIPDMSNIGKIDALIITHGHEDHIGAITHFKEHYPKVPIHTPLFASKLMEKKLKERGLGLKFKIYKPFDQISIGDSLTVTPVPVDHSIPETYGLLITDKDSDTAFMYASDFKINNTENKDLEKAAETFNKFKNRVTLLDSTNITSSQDKAFTEEELYPDLKKVISESGGRVFITAFASNVERTQTINRICKELKRPMVMLGRSMKFYAQVGIETKHLKEHTKIHYEFGIIKPNDDRLVCMVSGCQGDFKSATRRIISGDDSKIKLSKDDVFIFSSKTIPGNEKKLSMLENTLSDIGCKIIKPGKLKIHASGHACREDLKVMYSIFKPNFVIPIHGESTFLDAHIDFVTEILPEALSIRILNQSSLVFSKDGKHEFIKNEKINPILIHGRDIEIERSSISERRKMACNGVILISVNKKSKSYKLRLQGLPKALDEKEQQLNEIIQSHLNFSKNSSDTDSSEDLRIKVRRVCRELLGYKPVTFVHIV
ncbi:MAG: ribonuclease J [Bacteriovoracaceae bacterium]|nr:ribonuclease J [Bacteriovoracaceae bacterium]